MSLHSYFHFSRIAASLVLVASCASFAASAQQAKPAAAAEIKFPALSSSYLQNGSFVGPDRIRRVQSGWSKDQVRLEIGDPHYSEGLFGVNEWDYAFNFYTGKGNEYVTCQFKLKFDLMDGIYRAVSAHWKGNACESYLSQKVASVTPAVAAASVAAVAVAVAVAPMVAFAPAPSRVTLGTDGLFKYGQSSFNDLLPGGRSRLEALATQLGSDGIVLAAIAITGHTDRIGSDASNIALSQARANTVRSYLVSKGVDGRVIRTSGVGASTPVVQCAGNQTTPELVACLQPNRRVNIDIVAQR